MKTMLSIFLLCVLNGLVSAGPMEDAMNAALTGPEKKKLKVFDHEFNVKPVEVKRTETEIIVNGHISHHLRFRPDDQVYYHIVKKGNTIVKLERNIARGGWTGIVAPIASSLGTYLTGGTPIPPDRIEAIGRSIGKAVDGTWEGAADAIIANVAIRVK